LQDYAAEVFQRSGGTIFSHAVIDQQAGRSSHGYGNERKMADVWWDALMAAGVQVERIGTVASSGFFPSNPDIAARQAILQSWMLPRASGPWTGLPKLKIVRGCCDELDKEIRRAEMRPVKRSDRTIKVERRAALQEDVLVLLEYAAADNPAYRKPNNPKEYADLAVWRMHEERKHRRHANARATVTLG